MYGLNDNSATQRNCEKALSNHINNINAEASLFVSCYAFTPELLKQLSLNFYPERIRESGTVGEN